MRIRQHPGTGLWCREDGAVLMPPNGRNFKKFRWTYGCKYKDGYLVVRYHGKVYRVHRLIAETFLDNPLGLPTVDHINRIKTDNRAFENLRWADYKTQADNQQRVDDSIAKYGVRECDNPTDYARAYRANNPEFAEWQRTYQRERYANNPEQKRTYQRDRNRERYANDPEFVEQCCAYQREYRAKQKALGKRFRICPDGKRKWLTDEEFDARYGKSPTVMAGGAIGEDRN